jgi:hypothetical protein
MARLLLLVSILFLAASPSVAAAQAATPEAVSETTALLRLTLTAPWRENMAFVSLFRGTYAPGSSSQEISKRSPQLFFVETGTVTARLVAGEGAPVNLGGGPGSAPRLATPASDNAVQIGAGEAGLLQTGTTVEVHNEGNTPASVLWILSDAAATITDARDVTYDQLFGGVQQAIPPPPLVIGLDRVTLAPDATTTTAPPPTVTKVGPVDARRTGDLSTSSSGSARNLSATPLDIYVLTIAPGGPTPGTPEGATPQP